MTARTDLPSAPSRPSFAPRRDDEKTLFHLSPVPILLVTYPEGVFLDVNDAFSRELGIDAGAVVGRSSVEVGIWRHPSDLALFLERLAEDGRVAGWRTWICDARGRARAIEIHAERLWVEGHDCVLMVGLDISQTFYDSLTGLPNRTYVEQQLDRELESRGETGELTAVLFLAVDRLKGVNESLGHRAGDQVLQVVAARAAAALGDEVDLGRFGGDEFLAVLRVDDAEQAKAAAARLAKAVRRPLAVGTTPLCPSVSVGIAVASGDATASDLLRHADVAMRRAKRNGHDVEVFDAAVDQAAIATCNLEGALALAVERHELYVYYQPIVRTADLSVWGAEALARWDHPSWGAIPPAKFIPLAEATGQIYSIGMEILARACRQVASWLSEERVDPDFVLSVNVSALQIVDDRFAEDVAEVLRDTSLPAANLLLEITERHAVDQEVSVEPLKALGIRLAVDDFGEGFGCLAYLRKMPVDVLKVERSFVADLPQSPIDQVLMRSMLGLADGLARELIAEGVETAQQLRALRELGCQLAQGFLFGEPLPADELAEVVACRHPRMRWLQLVPALTAESTAAVRSAAVNGFDRNGVSLPTAPLVTSTSSR